jgi:CheY-like chemotaxis protein
VTATVPLEAATVRRLLLVEDNPADADLVREYLDVVDRDRHVVVHVGRLADALPKVATGEVDLVLLDLGLPDGEGVESVRAIQRVAGDIPIVVLTGLPDDELALACIDAGAEDYLSKAEIKPTLLRRVIGCAIARRREAQLGAAMSTLGHYRALSEAGTSITAAMVGVGPIRLRDPGLFAQLVVEYVEVIDTYIARLVVSKEKPRHRMEEMITRLGDAGAGPRDLMDLHVAALDSAVKGKGDARERALFVEARLVALELMGMLVDYYRVGSRRGRGQGKMR